MKNLISLILLLLTLFPVWGQQTGTIPPGKLNEPPVASKEDKHPVQIRDIEKRIRDMESWLGRIGKESKCANQLPKGNLIEIYSAYLLKYPDWKKEIERAESGFTCKAEYQELERTFSCLLSYNNKAKLSEAVNTLKDVDFRTSLKKTHLVSEELSGDIQKFFLYYLEKAQHKKKSFYETMEE